MPDLQEIIRLHNLSYHVSYAEAAEAQVGLRGKRVLEVGGSLPPEFTLEILGAKQWVGVQEADWYREVRAADQHSRFENVVPIEQAVSAERLGRYAVLVGGIEQLPVALHGHFDVVFSIAAFEHILRFGQALDLMAAALNRQGKLFSLFSPIWSAHDGHHLPEITDHQGRRFFFNSSPIPPWGHLYLTPPELYAHLRQHTDAQTAQEMVYYVYHSPQINRLFPEDYQAYVQLSALEGPITKTFLSPVPPEIQARIEARHPGRAHFDSGGLMMTLSKRNKDGP